DASAIDGINASVACVNDIVAEGRTAYGINTGFGLLAQTRIAETVMDADLPYTVLRDQIFTHPTMSETLNDLFSLIK
ncbi:aromatic amino acid lyase, partial [Salmonella enterica subsp. enterica serovar Anatum]|nr:aromatic amino acid lyase [Salmonella enterica subsp. enterica serovar Anatum]